MCSNMFRSGLYAVLVVWVLIGLSVHMFGVIVITGSIALLIDFAIFSVFSVCSDLLVCGRLGFVQNSFNILAACM